MSDYDIVSTLHATRVTLADARKAGDAAAVAAAEAQVAAARAAVDAALAGGRVVSDKHLLDLDLDSLGASPRDALRASQTCTAPPSALFDYDYDGDSDYPYGWIYGYGSESDADADYEHSYDLDGENVIKDDRAPVSAEVITHLPPLAPGLTRLAFSSSKLAAFGHPLPELRVLDWRGSQAKGDCFSFYWIDEDDEGYNLTRTVGGDDLHVPLAIPSAAIEPNLQTLLIGSKRRGEYNLTLNRGDFDMWTLVAACTASRVVVIENARACFAASLPALR